MNKSALNSKFSLILNFTYFSKNVVYFIAEKDMIHQMKKKKSIGKNLEGMIRMKTCRLLEGNFLINLLHSALVPFLT